VDKDGRLSVAEFVIGMCIISRQVNDSIPVPDRLLSQWEQWVKQFKPPMTALPSSPVHQSSSLFGGMFSGAPSQPNETTKPETNKGPSQWEMLSYASSKEGQDVANAGSKIAASNAGRAVASAAWENRAAVTNFAQSETGQAIGRAAWNNKEKVGQAVVKGASMI
jgi:hypothetical protein